MNKVSLTVMLLFIFSLMNAQIHEIGAFAGGSNFIGDVGKTNYINPNEFAYGLLYKWNKSPYHSWRFSYTQSKITAQDAKSKVPARKQRSYDFENSIKEVSLGLEFNFFNFNLHEFGQRVTPYVFGGLSYFRYDSQYVIAGATKIDKKNNAFAIPMVLGVKTNITPHFVLGLEAGVRYTFIDDMDGSLSENDKLEIYKFGNTNSNDWYAFTGLTLTYTFGRKPCYCAE